MFLTRRLAITVIALMLLAGGPIARAANGGRAASLLLVEYGQDDAGEQLQSLVRYRFEAGRLVTREPLVTTKTLDVRFDLGTNYLHQNRYVITHWGDVIDLETRRVVRRGRGEVVRVTGDRVFERVRRPDEKGLFSFDLKARRSTRIDLYDEEGWLADVVSPDGRRSAEEGDSKGLFLCEVGAARRPLGSNFGGGLGCFDGALPVLWLDSETLLALESGGRVVRIDVSTRKVAPVAQAPVGESFDECCARLGRDPGGTVYLTWLESSVNLVAIDVERRRVLPYDRVALGHGFDVGTEDDPSYERCATAAPRSADSGSRRGRRGLPMATSRSSTVRWGRTSPIPRVSPSGAESGSWTKFRPKWVATVVGWIDEGR